MLYVFDDYILDTQLYELRFRGALRALQPKPLDLLRFLLEHRDRVVLKAELLSALWPNVHVSDNALAQAVACVREALAETALPAIQSLRGRGYRFALEVRVTEDRASDAAPRPARRAVCDANDPDALGLALAPHVARGARIVRLGAGMPIDLSGGSAHLPTVLVVEHLERAERVTLAIFATLMHRETPGLTVLGTCDFSALAPSDDTHRALRELCASASVGAVPARPPLERHEAEATPLRVRSAS